MSTEITTKPADNPIGRAMVATCRDDAGRTVNTIVKYDKIRGAIRSMLTEVPLSERAGELYGMKKKTGVDASGKDIKERVMLITALGYDKLNQFAGVIPHQPPTVALGDNAMRPNPYIHEIDGRPVYIHVRMMGVGRNSVGNMVLFDNTLRFDLRGYFARDIYSKWFDSYNGIAKEWGKAYQTGKVPADVLKDPTKFCVEMPIGMTLVAQLDHKDFLKALGEQHERVRFAERIAQSICWRNLLKKYFGVISPKERWDKDGKTFLGYYVPVVSWPMLDRDYQAVGELVEEAKTGRVTMDGETIEAEIHKPVVETVDDPEDIDRDAADETDGEREPADDEPGASAGEVATGTADKAEPPADADPKHAMRARVRDLAGQVGEYAKVVLNQCGLLNGLASVAECESMAVLQGAIDRLEKQAAAKVKKASTKVGKDSEEGGLLG